MFRKTFLLTLLLAWLLTACTPAASQPGPLTFTDGLDRQVTLAGPAQRVVSLAPSNTEILFAIGAGDQVVGRDELSDYPEQAKSLEGVGGSMGQYSTEAIVALQPDLVLAAELNPPELVKTLEDLGLTVYYLNNPATLEELYTNLETVAQLTGREKEAKELIGSLMARVAAVDKKVSLASARPTVFYELDSTDPAKPWTAGPGSFIDLLITRAGGENIGSQLEGEWAQISVEQLVATNPDVILLGDAMWGVTVEAVKARPGWETLDAVQNDRIYPFDDNLVSRPGPRLVDGLEQLAKLLHPDLFQ
jgi:iron complex transport system substrate-binding protein